MSEVQPKVGEKWVDGHGDVWKVIYDRSGDGYAGKYFLVALEQSDSGELRTYTRSGQYRTGASRDQGFDLVRKYVPPMPTGVWGVDNLDDKLLAELKEWHANGGEIECRSPVPGSRWNRSHFLEPDKDFYYRARGCTSEPQPQRKPITAEEAFELWGKVICDQHGERWRVIGVHRLVITAATPNLTNNFTFECLLENGYTLDGNVICSGMSTKPQPGSVHVKLPSANG